MAMQKVYVGSHSDVVSFLESCAPDFFASVTTDNGITTCYDSDGNKAFEVEYNASSAYYYTRGFADDANPVYERLGLFPGYAFKTACGIMFTTESQGSCVVGKTNNGVFAVLLPCSTKWKSYSTIHAANDQRVIAQGDASPFTNLVNSGVVFTGEGMQYTQEWDQTILVPIPTHNTLGTPSYMADVFFTPIAQFRGVGVIDVDGVKYATDGIIALKDE